MFFLQRLELDLFIFGKRGCSSVLALLQELNDIGYRLFGLLHEQVGNHVL
jgi:hypothetical protein